MDNLNFLNEKLNSNFIINEFKNLASNEDLIKLKKNINFLYNKGIEYLKFETNPIRLHNIIHVTQFFAWLNIFKLSIQQIHRFIDLVLVYLLYFGD